MKKPTAVVLGLSAVLFAQVAYGADGYFYGGMYDKYMLGNGVRATEGGVAQSGVTFSFKNGAYVDLWGSVPLSGGPTNDFGKETDVTVGWKGAVSGLKLNAGLAHYNLYPTGTLNSFDVSSVFGEVSPKDAWQVGAKSTLTPFAKVEVVNSSGRGIKNATQVFGGLYSTIPFDDGWSLNQKLQIGHQPKLPGLSPGWNGYYKLAVEREFHNKLTVGAVYQRYQPFGLDGGRIKQNVIGVTFGYPF